MKNLYWGISGGIFVFFLFFFCQKNLAQRFNQNKEKLEIVLANDSLLRFNNEAILRLDQKVHDMEKYVNESQKYIDASQKNLDLWLKYLAFTLSILIGYSIFNGLKSRDLAKDELTEIRRIKEDIKKVANDAEDRLRIVKDQITQIETTAISAKNIEDKMTLQLNEIGSKADVILSEKQIKIIDESIVKTKEDLQKSGIEAFKNLYFAKALKSSSEKEWEDAIRLWNCYIDLDDSNARAYFNRATSYGQLGILNNNEKKLLNKAINNIDRAIEIDSEFADAIHNKSCFLFFLEDYEMALTDANAAINLSSDDILLYKNRLRIHEKLNNTQEAEYDRIKIKELETKNK